MGIVGDRATEVQWQMRVLKSVFTFSRGVFLHGAGGAAHVLLLELTCQKHQAQHGRARQLHLFHCTTVSANFMDIAGKPRFYQGPVPADVATNPRWTTENRFSRWGETSVTSAEGAAASSAQPTLEGLDE